MKIIQLSDLHIRNDNDFQYIANKVDSLVELVKTKVDKDEEVLLCVLGDIIDAGNLDACDSAINVLNYIKSKFSFFVNIKFAIVPGNHDLCSGDTARGIFYVYDKICTLFDYSCLGSMSCNVIEFSCVKVLLINSAYHLDHAYGQIDIEQVKDGIGEKNTLLVMHHSLIGVNNNDHSAIRCGYELLKIVEKRNVIGLLHGHTHGYKNLVFGENCRSVGVGPFLKQVEDINNQCNIVTLDRNGILSIDNCFYRADFNGYHSEKVFARKMAEVYVGTNLKKLYETIKNDVIENNIILNFAMKTSLPFSGFEQQILTDFAPDLEHARNWQNRSLPEMMYYNHRKYMGFEGKDGIDFIVSELIAKPTSSRAVIPLIDFKSVLNSGDGYLPSFNIVQFGFSDEDRSRLIITLYLRALEVNYFLKINLCEIYLMSKEVAQHIRSVRNIDIDIHAFRAQYKEKFGCFVKAKIDTLSSAKLLNKLSNKNFASIIELLKEKVDFCETIVNRDGLIELERAFEALAETENISNNVFVLLKDIEISMDELARERCKTSNYTLIKEKEDIVHTAFNNFVSLLEEGNIYESV